MSQIRSMNSIKSGIGLRELRAVLAVADLGSFRRAAAELGYTQSALSHQVAALEAALGWPLFHRPGGRGQGRMTPAGEAVCRRARRALGEDEAIAADAEEAERGESVRVRVGVSQTAAAELMPPALRSFRDEYPGVEVVLSGIDDSPGADALRKGRLDLAFINNPEPDDLIEPVAPPAAAADGGGPPAARRRQPEADRGWNPPPAAAPRPPAQGGPARFRTGGRISARWSGRAPAPGAIRRAAPARPGQVTGTARAMA